MIAIQSSNIKQSPQWKEKEGEVFIKCPQSRAVKKKGVITTKFTNILLDKAQNIIKINLLSYKHLSLNSPFLDRN